MKELFVLEGEELDFVYLNASNFMIKFPSPQMAKIALLRNLLKESETHFKIEEGGSWEIWNKGDNTKSPQGWIELHPY